MANSQNPLDQRRSLRRPVRALRYWVPVPRIFDAWAGYRDGRHDRKTQPAAAAHPDGGNGLASTLWLARNAHTFFERDRREFLHAQSVVADQRSALHRLYEAADRQASEVERLRAVRAAVAESPSSAELEARGPAEGIDSPEVIATRRRREHAARLGMLDGHIQAAAGRAEQLAEQIAGIEGELVTVFEITVTRSGQLRHFHERRAAVYRRWHRRAWRRHNQVNSTASDWPLHTCDQTIPSPPWASEPCPWIRRRAKEATLAGLS
jgi:hypothetical protein